MKTKTPRTKPVKRLVDRYLEEIIDYGGLPYTRAEVISDMQSMGCTQGEIDRWFQGYEFGAPARERYAREQATRRAATSKDPVEPLTPTSSESI